MADFPESLVDAATQASMSGDEQGVPDMRLVTAAVLRALADRADEQDALSISAMTLRKLADELEASTDVV